MDLGAPNDAVPSRPESALPAAAEIEADPALIAAGWERRFVIERARVTDYVRLYETLGFEVIAEEVRAEQAMADCTDCRIVTLLGFRMIYTRAKRAPGPEPPPTRSVGPA